MNDEDFTKFLIMLFLIGFYSENKCDANDEKEGKRSMNKFGKSILDGVNAFERLIRDGWVEIDTASKGNFERAIENSQLKFSKESVSDDDRFILLGTEDERAQVEMRKGMTYFYNPLMWRVKELDDDINDINKGWHDEIELDERSKEILDSIWPVIHGRVMQMISCGQ